MSFVSQLQRAFAVLGIYIYFPRFTKLGNAINDSVKSPYTKRFIYDF